MAEKRKRAQMRVITMRPVSIDVDETATHYLVFVSPQVEAQQQGIGYHRSRLPKCCCMFFKGANARCTWCKGWSPDGMARYIGKLLRSYPKIRITVPAEQVQTRRPAWTIRSGVAA